MTKQEVIDLLPELKKMTQSERVARYWQPLARKEITDEQYVFLTTLKTKPLVERDVSYAPDPASTVSGDTTHTDGVSGRTQKERLLSLLKDEKWHDTIEINRLVYGGEHLTQSRIAARINDLKNDGYDFEPARRKYGKVFEYRLLGKTEGEA